MITNLVETILTIGLATNVTISPETRSVLIPCPEGRIGCLVYHSRDEPVENPRWRTVETKVIRIRKTSIPSLGKSWDEEEIISRDVRFETRSEAWTIDPDRTERLKAGGVLLTIGGELPMISGPMNTFSNITRSADATNAAIGVWVSTNDDPAMTLVMTNYSAWVGGLRITKRASTPTNSIWVGGASITNVWTGKNEVPWEETPPPFLWPGETARTMHDSRGRFRAVGTNIVDGILSTTWKYEVAP